MNKNKIYECSKVMLFIATGLCWKTFTGDDENNYCWLPLVIAGAGLAASLIGGKKAKAPAPPKPIDPLARGPGNEPSIAETQATGLFKNYYPTAIPLALGASAKYGPQFMGQMFGQTGQFLSGVGGQPGFQELQRTTGAAAGETLGGLRATELGQMTGQAPLTRELMEALSPEQAAAVKASTQEAERATAAAQGVSPEERRGYEQQARESFQASGRLGGNLGIVEEAMGRESVLAKKREAAALAGKRSYDLAQQFYTTPGLQALSNAPLSYTAGQQDLRTALTLGPASSGEFDYNMPLNFAQQQAGAQNQYNQAVYQTNLANQQAKAQMWSSIGSSLMGAGLGGMGGGMASPNTMSMGNLGTYASNLFSNSTGQPMKAYTV